MLGGDFKGTITCYDCSSRPGLKTHRHSGKAYIYLDSTVVIVIFYRLNDIIIVQRFHIVAEFEQ